MDPVVSIVILSHNHPEYSRVCLQSLAITEGPAYETVVVDNGSDAETVEALKQCKEAGLITTLVLEKKNHFFSEGNNIGVRHSNAASKYILLLNNDVAILRGDWLSKMIEWMEGVPEHRPNIWGFRPTVPSPGPRDIVSIGWTYDNDVPHKVRPEGWCCMLRRSIWREISADFPFAYGLEEMLAKAMQGGAKAGCLSQYAKYLIHREQGSTYPGMGNDCRNRRDPDIKTWFAGVATESLDFTLGPDEHSSYILW